MVFPDDTACTDPGNIVGGAGWGGGVQAHPQQFFSVINLIYVFFKENYNFPRLQRGSNIFRGGGGGGQTLPGGGGGGEGVKV